MKPHKYSNIGTRYDLREGGRRKNYRKQLKSAARRMIKAITNDEE